MSATRLNPQEWTETINGWDVRHFADGSGRVEVRKKFSITNVSRQQWGSVYEAPFGSNVAYPFQFESKPSVRAEMVDSNIAVLSLEISISGTAAGTTSVAPNVWITSASSGGQISATIILYATGVPA